MREFEFSTRVPYAHVDKMNHVYYAHYLVYFEMARSALLREAGLPYPELEERGVMLPVVEAHCRYRQPARYDDLITVVSSLSIRRSILRIEYRLHRDGLTLAEGYTLHACMNPEGKILRPPPELAELFG